MSHLRDRTYHGVPRIANFLRKFEGFRGWLSGTMNKAQLNPSIRVVKVDSGQ
jgi:hypothetical protein